MDQNKTVRILFASLGGLLPAYFLTSLFTYFYPSRFSLLALSLAFSLTFIALTLLLADSFFTRLRAWRTESGGMLALLAAAGLTVAALQLCRQFPTLFDRRLLFLGAQGLPWFAGGFLGAMAAIFALLANSSRWQDLSRLKSSRPISWMRENLSGLLLTCLFFLVYFPLASTLNFPGFRTVDQYFDLDVSTWLERFQTVPASAISDGIRAVHPAVMVLLRPFIWLASLLLHGDRLYGVFLFHALAASACVFLTWKIVRRATSSSSLGLIAATLLGASASHLLLGSMVETYIYSALTLLVFVSLMQADEPPFRATVLTGAVAFGITVSNVAQTLILYFIKRPRIKTILAFTLLVAAIVFALNLVQTQVYPRAASLLPSSVSREKKFQSGLWENRKRMAGRTVLTGRAILFYGIVAPKPFILTEELGTTLPSFRTFRQTPGNFQVAGFEGLGDWTAKAWLLIVFGATCLFALDWLKGPRPILATALLACLGFNFVLHVVYGDDPLLYSADWVYALVLLVGFSFRRFAARTWLQLPLAGFLLPLIVVNLGLLRQIIEVSIPLYGH